MTALRSPAEKRGHPRFRVALRARLCGTTVSVRNVSRTGMQVACTSTFYDLLTRKLAAVDWPCPLELDLPAAETVTLPSSVVYVNDYDDEYLMGIELSTVPGPDRLGYQTYLDSLAASKAPIVG